MDEIGFASSAEIGSLDNIDNNFSLSTRIPKKGKLYTKRHYHAFNKEMLGSIPSRLENVIIRDKGLDRKVGFSSQSIKFANKVDKQDNRPIYSQMSDSTNPSHSEKGFGNGFCSQSSRFHDEYRSYQDKFKPGPGSYRTSEYNTIEENVNGTEFLKGLYREEYDRKLKPKEKELGPGEYELINEIYEPKHPSSFFASQEKRFKKRVEQFPSPGQYETKPGLGVKRPSKTSFFFKKSFQKPKEELISKIVRERSQPKKYGFSGLLDRNKMLGVLRDSAKFAKMMSEKGRTTHTVDVEGVKTTIPEEDDYEKQWNDKGITSVFKSEAKKLDYFKNKRIPGPAYYKPEKLPERVSFRYPLD